jgi:hypothetical protein
MNFLSFLLTIIFVSVSLFGQDIPDLPDPPCEPDWLPIRDDGRHWELNFDKKLDDQFVMEWNLAWETRENWTEIFTFMGQTVTASVDINSFFMQYMQNLQREMGNDPVHYHVYWAEPHSMYYEFWINQGGPKDQYEMARMFKYKDRILVLRYTTKKMKSENPHCKHYEAGLQAAEFRKMIL